MTKIFFCIVLLFLLGVPVSKGQVPPGKVGTMKVRKVKSETQPTKIRKYFKPTINSDFQ